MRLTSRGMYLHKQIYEMYCGNEKLSPLVKEISWTSNLLIMSDYKTDKLRELTELVLEKPLEISQNRTGRKDR